MLDYRFRVCTVSRAGHGIASVGIADLPGRRSSNEEKDTGRHGHWRRHRGDDSSRAITIDSQVPACLVRLRTKCVCLHV